MPFESGNGLLSDNRLRGGERSRGVKTLLIYNGSQQVFIAKIRSAFKQLKSNKLGRAL
jgi:hypothetical protein